MRAVDSTTLELLSDSITRPYHIVKIDFEAATTYLSEGVQTTHNGNVYQEAGIKVGNFKWKADGSQQGTVTLLDENGSAISLVLNDDISNIPIEIYSVYRTATGNTKPILYVKGTLDEAVITPDDVTISVISIKSSYEFIPNVYCTVENGFNFLPAHGDVINWAGEKFELVRA